MTTTTSQELRSLLLKNEITTDVANNVSKDQARFRAFRNLITGLDEANNRRNISDLIQDVTESFEVMPVEKITQGKINTLAQVISLLRLIEQNDEEISLLKADCDTLAKAI